MREIHNFAECLRSLEEDELMAYVGKSTWTKGVNLAHHDRVVHPHFDESGTLIGRVQDSGLSYKTSVTYESERWDMTCACTIGRDCKHAVAIIVAMRALLLEEENDDAPWRQALQTLTGETSSEGENLALLVDAHDPHQPIWVTPMRAGTRVTWTHKRAGWQDLTSVQWASVTDGINPQHLQLIREGYRISRQSHPGQLPGEVSLESLGQQAHRWLTQLHQAGVQLLASTDPVTVLHIDPSTWDIDFDATLGEEGLRLKMIARNGDTTVLNPRMNTETSLLILDGGTRIARVHSAAKMNELPEGGVIHIPRKDVGEFRSTWLPRLRRQYAIVSSDKTMDTLLEQPARIIATVRLEGTRNVVVRWWGEYVIDGHHVRSPLSKVLDDLEIAQLRHEIDTVGARLLKDRWVRPPRPLTCAPWEAPHFLSTIVPQMRHRGLEWDIAPEVDGIDIADDAMTVTAQLKEGKADWFDLQVNIEIAGQHIRIKDLLTALAAGEEYMDINGTWVHLDSERIHDLKNMMDEVLSTAAEDPQDEHLRLNLLHVGLWEELEQRVDRVEAARSWQEKISVLHDEAEETFALPHDMRAQLRPYQHEGYAWLVHRARMGLGGILADDMGLGKTLQILTLISHIAQSHSATQENGHVAPILVVVPTSVQSTWKHEAHKFFPSLRVQLVAETAKRRGRSIEEIAREADVIVTTYTIIRLEAHSWAELEFSGLIIDEAQAVKNPKTAIHRALERIRTPWCFAVSGTPVENSLTDLWSILSLATPGLLPDWETFHAQYRKPIEHEGSVRALRQLQRLISPFMLRRTKEEVTTELPDKVESIVEIELGEEHRRIYDQYLTRQRAKILSLLDDYSYHRIDVLAAITRLRQLALDPILVDKNYEHVGSAKVEYLADQLAQIVPRGHRALVFSQFTSFLERIHHTLTRRGISVVQLDGSTRNREKVMTQFREGEAQVFLISLKAGGTGLTLTEADYVYIMDPWWNPAAEAQAVDRAHRIGQTKKVNVYRFVASGTIEQKVVALQERKRQLVTSVIDGTENTARLSVADLRALLQE